MKNLIIIFLILIIFHIGETKAQQKFCLQSVASAPLILVKNPGTTFSNLKINELLSKKEILINKSSTAESFSTLFAMDQLSIGDCLLLDRREEDRFSITTIEDFHPWYSFVTGTSKKETKEAKELIPVIIQRFIGKIREYGFIASGSLEQLQENSLQETKTEEILKHPLPKDIVVIYIICDKEREKTCELSIKHGNKWISKFSTKKREIPVIAKSRRETATLQKGSYRIGIKGDTPQGIYHLWASMFSDNAAFGLINRIDMDATFSPLNSHNYEIYRPILESLIPAKSINDYWVQEWPLAFNLGRNTLRLHDNSLDPQKPDTYQPIGSNEKYRATDGCINTGRFMKEILAVLTELGIFQREELDIRDQPLKLNWKVTSKLGNAYILVKDRIE